MKSSQPRKLLRWCVPNGEADIGPNDDIASAEDCRVWHSSDMHDHADVFVLLVCWMYRHDIQATLQMEQIATSTPPVVNSARSARIS